MRNVKIAVLAASVAAASSAFGAIQPASPYDNPESLILGFDSNGASTNLTFNLGTPTDFKNAFLGGSNIFLGNIGADLAAEFGSTWYNGTGGFSVLFGVAGASNNAGGIQGAGSANAYGDFNSTVYASRARSAVAAPGTAGSSPWSIAAASVTTAASQMVQLGNTFNAGQVNNKLVVGDATGNDWQDFNPEAGGIQSSFTVFTDTNGAQTALDAGQFSNPSFAGLTNVEGVVDLYRVSRYTNGGLVGGGAQTAGLGQFLGSIALTQSGDVYYVMTTDSPAVPEPGTALFAGLPLLGMALRRRRQA